MTLQSLCDRLMPTRLRRARWRRSLPEPVRALFPLPPALEQTIDTLTATMNVLPGGWCPDTKQHVLAGLILAYHCQRVVEIGVFQGGSLLPMAAAARLTGGVVTGVDPYTAGAAEQRENLDRFVPIVGADWHTRIEWDALYDRVLAGVQRHGLASHCRIMRATSVEAAQTVPHGLDLLHVDGNHDFAAVEADLRLYVPKVRSGGFIVLDDTHWDGVHAHYVQLKQRLQVFHEAFGPSERPEWAVLVQD